MDQRRILHVISSLAGGGAEQQLMYLLEQQHHLGWEVHVAYYLEVPEGVPEAFNKAKLHRIPVSHNYDPRLLWYLHRLLIKLRPQVFQTWNPQMDIVGGFLMYWSRGCWVLREPSCTDAWPNTWKYRLRIALAKRAKAIVANSKRGAAYWQEKRPFIPNYVIHNGFPLTRINAMLPVELDIPSGMQLVLYGGRLESGKNVDVLISAIAELVNEPPVILFICGDGSLRRNLERLAKSLGVSKQVRFLGRRSATELWRLMKRANLFVYLSDFEGFPNAVAEAMTADVPVLVSDIPAHRALVDESCALLVKPRDIVQVTAVLRLALADSEGAMTRRLLAAERARHWSAIATAEQYENLYNKMCSVQFA